jgi:hypothetical protein
MEEAALPTRQSFDDLEPFRIQERHVVLLSRLGETISLPYPQRRPSLSDAMPRPSNGRFILFRQHRSKHQLRRANAPADQVLVQDWMNRIVYSSTILTWGSR